MARLRKDMTSGCLSARATAVKRRASGATAVGRPARMAFTPARCNAASNTSAAPLLWVTASTRGVFLLSAPARRNADDTRRLAVRVLPVPGGPRTSPTVRPSAHATQSICRSFGVNCASADAPAITLRMPSSSVGAVAPPGIPANSRRASSEAARRRGARGVVEAGREARRAPRPLCPPRPARARRAGPRAARAAPTCRGARRPDPGRRRASHVFPGQVSPTATVSQSTPVSTTATSRGAAAASKVSVSTSPRVNCSRPRLFSPLRVTRKSSRRSAECGAAVPNSETPASSSASSLRPRRALPSELGSRRARYSSSTSASQRCA